MAKRTSPSTQLELGDPADPADSLFSPPMFLGDMNLGFRSGSPFPMDGSAPGNLPSPNAPYDYYASLRSPADSATVSSFDSRFGMWPVRGSAQPLDADPILSLVSASKRRKVDMENSIAENSNWFTVGSLTYDPTPHIPQILERGVQGPQNKNKRVESISGEWTPQ